MGYKEFTKSEIADTDRRDVWEAAIEIDGGGVSDWYLVPAGAGSVNIDTIPNGNYYIETTGEPIEKVKNNTASGVTWPPGIIATREQRTAVGFTAIRATLASGSLKVYLRAI